MSNNSNQDTSASGYDLTCSTPEEVPHHTEPAIPGPSQRAKVKTAKEEEPAPAPAPAAATTTANAPTFATLPPEIRALIWAHALPASRVFNALVWVSAGLKMQLLNRSELAMPLAQTCFESRQAVQEAGYVLAFRDEDEPDDPGVWFHPRRDRIERTIWGPGDWNSGV